MTAERVTLKVKPKIEAYECLCVEIEGIIGDTYLPHAQIEDKKFGEDGVLCSLSVPKWLAEVRKLI